MLYVAAVLSISITMLYFLATFKVAPITMFDSVTLGILSTISFYLYIFLKKIYFKWNHLLIGFSSSLVCFIMIVYYHYNHIIKHGYYQTISRQGLDFINYREGFLYFLFQYKLEGLVFLLASTIVAMFIVGSMLRCKECNNGIFIESLLFKGSHSYHDDAKQFITLADRHNESGLQNFIKERRIDTGFSSRNKDKSTFSFYFLKCNNCGTQFIVSKQPRDISDSTEKKTYSVITKLDSKMQLKLK